MADTANSTGGGIESAAATVARFRDCFLARISDGDFDLPVLPESAHRVMQATADENCDARQLSELIRRDAALAGHVLRIANSALYAPTSPIVSLQQAVSRLGMKKIKEIALLIATQTKVFKVPGYDAQVRAVFKHSVAAAAWSQEIARSRRWNVEDAFLCGLLHDAGKPVLWQLLVDVQKELKLGVEAGLADDIVESMHGAVGSRLVESWKLPERIAETIAHHHRPQEAATAAQAAMMTGFADSLAHFAVGPRAVTEEEVRACPLIEPLNIYRDELEALIAKKETIASAAEAIQ